MTAPAPVGAEGVHAWARERWLIKQRRDAGLPRPWTDDPIMQRYRFCNVYREDDKVTSWLRESWRESHADDPDLWSAFVVARHVNNVPTLESMDFPVPWRPERYVEVLQGRRTRGLTAYSAAYMIGTSGTRMDKSEYLCRYIFDPMWAQRAGLRPRPGDTLTAYHVLLGQLYGLASFLAAQVVADLKYVAPLSEAQDWWTFAASGPGSRRGLNRVLGRPVDAPWREDDWRLALARLRAELLPMFAASGMPEPHAQDCQSLLCEVDKYYRARLSEGRPKQTYPGV